MARVFISYKRADKDLVFPLKEKIEAVIGEPCWIDLEGIESDAQFAENIISAIDEASVVLFMYSCNHAKITNFTADWTVRELSYAQKTGKHIVFVNLDQSSLAEWFNFMFPQQQIINATSSEDVNLLQNNLKKWLNITPNDQQSVFSFTEGFKYSYNSKTHEATICEFENTKDTMIVIPPVVKYKEEDYQVTAIGSGAFWDKFNIKSVVISNSVTHIGAWAFYGCKNLQSITIPNSVSYIGRHAFTDCISLQYISLPKSVRVVKRYAFDGCSNLKSIDIPNELTHLGMGAFDGCSSLRSISIPYGLSVIKSFTFSDCRQLSITSIPDNIRRIGFFAFFGCRQIRMISVPQKTFIVLGAFDMSCKIIRSK